MKETENSAQEQYEKEKTNGYADGKYYTCGNRTQESKKCGERQTGASRNRQIAASMMQANAMSTIKKRDGFASVSIPFAKSVKIVNASSIPTTMVIMQNLVAFFIGILLSSEKIWGKLYSHTLRYAGKQKVWLLQAK